jgi:hypothetical protein
MGQEGPIGRQQRAAVKATSRFASAVSLREGQVTERYVSLAPGFATDVDFVFETPQSEVRSLACDARAHGLPLRVN